MENTNRYIFFTMFLTFVFGCNSNKYLSQKPPKLIPEIFAPGIVSINNRNEEVITFSPNGLEIYFSIEYYPDPTPSFILFTEFKDGKWTEPDTVSFSKGRRTSEPFIALSGSRLYYFANKVENQKGSLDICYSERNVEGWGDPISLNSPPNFITPKFTLHPCIVSDSSIYFSTYSGEIAYSKFENGEYQEMKILPSPINHQNLEGTECWGDPYVSPNEEYMIFRSNREGGYGGSDLYISFRNESGQWLNPQNLGPTINTEFDELGGDVTPDGKYLTFGRNGDIYWVSTRILKKMKKNPVHNITLDAAGGSE
ncbi:hypothetical protein J2X69_004741 [Algoriphagus sp. 4150]|uniref:hypothetical protein n=1 Tax=Algoriphagus sp. 4150 TaxID=2817756 RepID=UPI0028546ACC|nr:hypothetical protein [Algoriphagus sp. 4150]MDR7132374.1 hypothetical protein [Algoriphagus sp. 4150]